MTHNTPAPLLLHLLVYWSLFCTFIFAFL